MTDPERTLAAINAQRVVPVLRSPDVADAVATGLALREVGMTVVELTRSTPGVHEAVAALAEAGLIVGLGTLPAVDEVPDAVEAGARFVVSFAGVDGLVAAAGGHGVLGVPAGMTPTEVLRAADSGARLVKLFPANVVGPAIVRHLRTVMPDTPLMATGGIPAVGDEVRTWLDGGCVAVGVGSDLGSASIHGVEAVRGRAAALLADLPPAT